MKSETRDILIGAAAMGCLALVFVYLYGGREVTAAAGETEIVAVFDRVDGLLEGDTVTLGGIKVGSVGRMALNENYRAVVTMRIAGGVKLPTDTSAAIHTDGLFGSKFVVLQPGGAEDYMESGDEITYTQGAVVVSELLDLIISEGRAAVGKRGAAGK